MRMSLKVYIAARFSRRHECYALGKELERLGHVVVSRWMLPDSDHVSPPDGSDIQNKDQERFAREDLDDVDKCDWFISLMEQPRSNGRGGRHVEFGYALAKGKTLTIIGPKETVFHHLDEIACYQTVSEFLAWL